MPRSDNEDPKSVGRKTDADWLEPISLNCVNDRTDSEEFSIAKLRHEHVLDPTDCARIDSERDIRAHSHALAATLSRANPSIDNPLATRDKLRKEREEPKSKKPKRLVCAPV